MKESEDRETNSVHPKMPFDEYNGDPCPEPSIRSGLVSTILDRSPYHGWFEHPRLNPDYREKAREDFDLGSVAHEIVVGGEDRIAVLDFDAYRSNAAKQAREEAYAAGKTPILAHKLAGVHKMRDALRDQLNARKMGYVFGDEGAPELTMLWHDLVWFRSRPDWVSAHKHGPVVYDYKTCGVSCNPEAIQRHAFNMGWDIKAALIARGMKACYGVDAEVRFVCQEVTPPYGMSIIAFSAYSLSYADDEITRAAKIWRDCLDRKRWPLYPHAVKYLDAPQYLVTQREVRGEG